MIHVIINFKVLPEHVDQAKKFINRFKEFIALHERGTLAYHSFQDALDNTRFTHMMIFEDIEAQQFHRETAYCRNFVNCLYPLCEETPITRELTEIAPDFKPVSLAS